MKDKNLKEKKFAQRRGHTIAQDRFFLSPHVHFDPANCDSCIHGELIKNGTDQYCHFYKSNIGLLDIDIDIWNCKNYTKV